MLVLRNTLGVLTFGVLAFAVVRSTAASAQSCPTFNTLANGTTADANQVMDNFNHILECPHFTGTVGIGAPPATNAITVVGSEDMGLSIGDGYDYMEIAHRGWSASFGLLFNAAKTPSWASVPGDLFVTGNTKYKYPGGTYYTSAAAIGGYLNNGKGGVVSIYGAPPGTAGGNVSWNQMAEWANQDHVWFSARGSDADFFLDSSGRIGIGTASPAQMLDVAGTIRQAGCTTAGTLSVNSSGDIICTSDARLKNIRGPFQGGLDAISKIQPMLFSYRPTAADPNEAFVHAGFIAQNVKAAIPQASALQHDGYYSLDTTAILAAAVNAIKELKDRNTKLAKKLAVLQDATNRLSQEVRLLNAKLDGRDIRGPAQPLSASVIVPQKIAAIQR